MREQFPGHFVPTEKEFSILWKSAIVCFDTNVLLNLYRYSDSTKAALKDIMLKYKERLFLPNQVGLEFLTNRLKATSEHAREYKKSIEGIDSVLNLLSNNDRHPFLPKDEYTKLKTTTDEIKVVLEDKKSALEAQLNEDPLLEFIEKLFEGRTGKAYSKEELEKLYEDGEARFAKKTPPGYMDADKDKSGDKTKKFGDLVLWKQILDYASSEKTNVIVVTGETKEDWWTKASGRIIAPRPEMITEFREVCGGQVWFYSADRFMELASKNLSQGVKPEVVEEIKKVSLQDKAARKHYKQKVISLQEAEGGGKTSQSGEAIILVAGDTNYATGTFSFQPTMASIPNLAIELSNFPDALEEELEVSQGCGKPSTFSIHIKSSSGEKLPHGEYVFKYNAEVRRSEYIEDMNVIREALDRFLNERKK